MKKLIILLFIALFFIVPPMVGAAEVTTTTTTVTTEEPVTTTTTEEPVTTVTEAPITTVPVTDEVPLTTTLFFEEWADNFFSDFTFSGVMQLINVALVILGAFLALNANIRERVQRLVAKRAELKVTKLELALESSMAVLGQTNNVLNLIVQGSKLDSSVKDSVSQNTVRVGMLLDTVVKTLSNDMSDFTRSAPELLQDVQSLINIVSQGASIAKGILPIKPSDKPGV